MRRFIKSLSILAAIFVGYKLILFGAIMWCKSSPYNVTANYRERDYGINSAKNFIIVGTSNVKANFDYNRINNQLNGFTARSSSLTSPWGLYLMLKNAKANSTLNDIMLFDFTYNIYEEDNFLPANTAVYGCLSLEDYKSVLKFSPKILCKYLINQSVLNSNLITYFELVFNNWKNSTSSVLNPLGKNELLITQTPHNGSFLDSYFDCSYPYKAKEQRVGNELNMTYIKKVKNYIDANFNQPHYYYLPELNKNNYSFRTTEIDTLANIFSTINSFSSSQFLNNQMDVPHYHLNKCGATANTTTLLNYLKSADYLPKGSIK
ncbi:hypothetical protein [Ferruginibacter albus]|uniref:hypothetical protein n=1 Tax=Ferruginibacter albus TaxID=2875540 RepID=UPI001CC80BF0|nr:hypothetical protein [Ferruginibacter albus]UAY52159.1 hypothetical protein K9M53_00350 [Ferruginibacter albus]